jgi:hypothetical protein
MVRLPTLIAMIAGLAAGCAKGDMDAADARPTTDADPGAADAPPDEPDADPDQPDAEPHVDSGHLLLSELVLTPTLGEYIEIVNPTGAAIDLDDYYLADNAAYFQVPAGVPSIDSSDFIVKFPAGASIPPGGALTVALAAAADFQTTYGVAPTFSMISGPTLMISVASSAGSTLTNAGEAVALFHWDGASDLVQDVDLVIAGAPSAGNQFTNKSGVAQDGPDAGTATSAYAGDANALPTTAAPAAAASLKRILGEAGHENQSGTGNGLTGDDETSEQTGTTWDDGTGAPTPNAAAI